MCLSWRDDWPVMPDGTDFDGEQLLSLVRSGNSPFHGVWDVNLLIREIEENLGSQVIDILTVNRGSNNYVRFSPLSTFIFIFFSFGKNPPNFQNAETKPFGPPIPLQGFHIKLSNQLEIVARLSRGDINMPNFSGFPIESQVAEVNFEASVYMLLRSEPRIMVSRLLYHRIPVEHVELAHSLDHPPLDIAGRRLFLFERSEGEKDVWRELSPDEQVHIPFLFHPFDLFLLKSLQFTHLDISLSLLGSPSCSGSPDPCIIVRIQSPAELCRPMAP